MDFTPGRSRPESPDAGRVVQVQVRRDFARLLAFAGWTIDDVVNCPVARRSVRQWFLADRRLHRRLDMLALERQWNPLGR